MVDGIPNLATRQPGPSRHGGFPSLPVASRRELLEPYQSSLLLSDTLVRGPHPLGRNRSPSSCIKQDQKTFSLPPLLAAMLTVNSPQRPSSPMASARPGSSLPPSGPEPGLDNRDQARTLAYLKPSKSHRYSTTIRIVAKESSRRVTQAFSFLFRHRPAPSHKVESCPSISDSFSACLRSRFRSSEPEHAEA